ncbi:Hypothetical protein, putative [Bodo saltans]|uniref:Uncharacterized protein n=1 Tax=Bodo saltans TaxID=75058 RepID=A0A0S4KJN6_BODSA|nr:Hypothetical protein, putative [Bodo saltans]|eukprot:CUI14797.1 Hypothetical protein, putative [Bodo saltans]
MNYHRIQQQPLPQHQQHGFTHQQRAEQEEDVKCLPPMTHRPKDDGPQHQIMKKQFVSQQHHHEAPHFSQHEDADAIAKRTGKARRVPGCDEHKQDRSTARQIGNPFQAVQESHKYVSDRGRQVGARVIDTDSIHPTAGVAQSHARAQTFEQGPYTILPDREKPYVPQRRPSQHSQETSLNSNNSYDGGALDRKPSLRLRNNNDEEKLRKLLPDARDDVRRNYANVVANQSHESYIERMVKQQFPIPRGGPGVVVDCEFPPIHTRPSPRKYETHLPGFGLTISAQQQQQQAHTTAAGSASLSPTAASNVPPKSSLHHALPSEPLSSRRVMKQPSSSLQQQQPPEDYRSGMRLIPRGYHESARSIGWNIITGDGGG